MTPEQLEYVMKHWLRNELNARQWMRSVRTGATFVLFRVEMDFLEDKRWYPVHFELLEVEKSESIIVKPHELYKWIETKQMHILKSE